MPWDLKKQSSTSSTRRLSSLNPQPTLRRTPNEHLRVELLCSMAEGAVMLWWVLRRHSKQIWRGIRALVPRCNVGRIPEHGAFNIDRTAMTWPKTNNVRRLALNDK